jgi:hypothetical protein
MPSTVQPSELPVNIASAFPDLGEVGRGLYPETFPVRPPVEEYAAGLEAQGRLTPAVIEAIEKALAVQESTSCITYIAGALTGVSETIKSRYGVVSDMLAEFPPVSDEKMHAIFGYVPHLHGTDPVKHPNVTPQEVRDIDFLWSAVVADIHINFLDPTAHGNAIEEAWAESRLIPTIYLNPEGNRLSRLTLGMHNVIENISYSEFQAEDDSAFARKALLSSTKMNQTGLDRIKTICEELHAWLRIFPGRDPREFHYGSFQRLANPTARLAGLPSKKGYGMEELVEIFGLQSFVVYIKDRCHPDYGKIARIDSAHDYTGFIVTTLEGNTWQFDSLVAGSSLSFWPIDPTSSFALEVAMIKASGLPDPE